MYSESKDVSSKSVHDVVDSKQTSVTSSSSLSVWNRSEAAAASWRAATAVSGLPHRVLSPLSGVDRSQLVRVEEDSDVVDRATLPRVAKRSLSSVPVISQTSTFSVC